MGLKNPFYGKHHTKETKEKLSKLLEGKHNNPQFEFKKGCIPHNKGVKQKPPIPKIERYRKIGNFDCKVIWEDDFSGDNWEPNILTKLGF